MIWLKASTQYNNFSYLKKRFIKKSNLNKQEFFLFSLKNLKKEKKVLILSNELEIKTALYRIYKGIQVLKRRKINAFNSYNFLPQRSLLLNSSVERKKKADLRKVKRKLRKSFYFLKKSRLYPFKFSFKRQLFLLKNFDGFINYKKLQFRFLTKTERKKKLFKFFKLKRAFKAIMERRFLIHRFKIQSKKKYKKLFRFLFLRKNKKSFKAMLKLFVTYFHKFSNKRKKKRKTFKRLLRKRARFKRWKRRGVFRSFRKKLRFYNKFYVPRHFEINYKTGEIFYLGFVDLQGLSFRIPFMLNLRRLVTFLSF